MNLQFLWDEEKTRKLHKFQLILNVVASFPALIFSFLLPGDTPHRLLIIFLPMLTIIYSLICVTYLINKPHQGIRFLITNLLVQFNVATFMALTGGFLSIVQFAPYVILLLSLFQLGSVATLILGVFTILTFIGILIWSYLNSPNNFLFLNFFFYVAIYIIIIVIMGRIGRELSVQFEARKKLEQIDDLKNQFLTITSHYLRTPLTNIKNALSQLKDPNSQQKSRSLDQIDKNILKLDQLIEKFLYISAIEKGQIKIIPLSGDLNQLVANTTLDFQPLAREKAIKLEFKSLSLIPRFNFDSIKLKQVIFNLIDNAIKFNLPNGFVLVTLNKQDNWAIIEVKDSGQGISKEHLETLFTTFNRGSLEKTLQFDQAGVGLSLYLSKLIIEAHGGKISAYSSEGKGATFTVNLPIR